jgi:CarD family transcriptional regulator
MRAAEPDFKQGDRVVYPNQGVCRITGIAEKEISGQKLTFVVMQREEDSATVMVPKDKLRANGIRKVASEADIKKVFTYLTEDSAGPELDWKIRSRSHVEKLSAGDIRSVAEVVKALQSLSELRPLPPKERETYDGARHLLVGEVSVALSIPEVTAEDCVDLALYPPGVERKKPVIAPVPSAGGEDFDLAEDLGAEEEPVEEAEPESEEKAESGDEEGEETPKGKAGRKPKAPPKAAAKTKTASQKPPKATKPPAAKKAAPLAPEAAPKKKPGKSKN